MGIAFLLALIVAAECFPAGWALFHTNKMANDTAGFHEAALAVEALLAGNAPQARVAHSRRRAFEQDGQRAAYPYGGRSGNAVTGGGWRRFERDGRYRFERSDGRGRRSAYGGDSAGRGFAFHGQWRKGNSSGASAFRRDSGYRTYNRPARVIDINEADSAAWESLPGIGPVLAGRIMRFRERLGGFYEMAQVGETWGLADSVFKKIQGMLVMREVSLRKTDLNQTDEKSLAEHPYINTKLARLIVRYRSNHGPFRHPAELQRIALVNDSIYRKLEKYLVAN
ncbi:hypothetical protein DLD77_09755 [Chitinophaga alhagiae]|uniref:Helix-hairpin-helix domain-containing protein n=2 Tax=Chitinophaga alhagiae TaxID=2203219 RepID=A0ABN5LYL5_9BACT|nr:hypothetical protein DLD77_09755 [Chitinophaga alhagiae]